MKKTIVTTLITIVLALAMTITTYAAGSIVGSIDMPNTSAGDVEVELKAAGSSYATEVQTVVDAINNAESTKSLGDVIEPLVSTQIDRYAYDGVTETDVDLSKYRFLSPVMELTLKNATPSMTSRVRVTFVSPAISTRIDVDVLHYCDEHGWEILTGYEGYNQVEADFHSLSPVALIYRDVKKPSGGGWSAPSFYPTATPAATALPTAAPVVVPVDKDDVDVEDSDVIEESSEESVVESSEESLVESSEESVVESSEESGVPAGAEAEGSGSALPIVLIVAALVAIGIFLIIFLKRKKDEE